MVNLDDVLRRIGQMGICSDSDFAEFSESLRSSPRSETIIADAEAMLSGNSLSEEHMKQIHDNMMSTMAHMVYKVHKNSEKCKQKEEVTKTEQPTPSTAEDVESIAKYRKDNVLGKVFVVCHLKDKTGRTLNGEKCEAVTFDEDNPWHGRFHCKMLTGEKKGRMFRIRYANLMDGDGWALIKIPQPSPPDIMDPKDFLVTMIIAWTSSQKGVPPPSVSDKFLDALDSAYRQLIVARYIVHHLGVSKYENITETDVEYSSKIYEEADLVGLVNRFHKREPDFFTNDFSAYWLMELRAKRYPEKAHKAEAHLLKKGGFTNVKKNKKRLVEALSLALDLIVLELTPHKPSMHSGKLTEDVLHCIDFHNAVLPVIQRLDVATPKLQCGKVTGNAYPETMEKLAAQKIGDEPSVTRWNTAIQSGCCGDGELDFRRFNFGLTGSGNLPPCPLCLEALELSDKQVAKLDCQHIFHKDCIAEWFQDGRRDCPSCKTVHVGLACYDFLDQLQERFVRYIAFGVCERCQSFVIERKNKDLLEKDRVFARRSTGVNHKYNKIKI